MKNVYLRKPFNFFQYICKSSTWNLSSFAFFVSYECKVLENAHNDKTYFKKLRSKRYFKIFLLRGILSKNIRKIGEFFYKIQVDISD